MRRFRPLPVLVLSSVLAVATGGVGGCVPVPMHVASGLSGRVVDADSGEPLADAVVVVAFEGSYDRVLPEREPLGHREAVTDAEGRFQTAPLVARGMAAWPWLHVQPRIVAAWAPEHRCVSNLLPPAKGGVQVALAKASDADDQRETCRAVPAPFQDTPRYTRLWRELHSGKSRRLARDEPNPALERSLAARSSLGFGANCRGPVLDVSLDPAGDRVGLLVREGDRLAVRLLELAGTRAPTQRSEPDASPSKSSPGPSGRLLLHASLRPERRLAWSPDGELFLVTGNGRFETAADATVAAREAARQRVWSPEEIALPAAPAPLVSLDDESGNHDDASNRYGGRSFETLQGLDPETGLPTDRLRVGEPDGSVREIALPGEACREGGRFGRPHYRLTRDGNRGLDLRYVDGRCRAIAIDLASGDWQALGPADSEPAVCATSRRLPRLQLALALRGYGQELEDRLSAASLDPFASFTLLLGEDGRATIRSVDAAGVRRRIAAPPFPITTPLEQIEISVIAPPPAGLAPSVEAGPAEDWKPL